MKTPYKNRMYDDRRPITVVSRGWEELPDGTWQGLIECNTIVEFITLPKNLVFEAKTYRRVGWDLERKVAFFRDDAEHFIKK